MDILIIFMGLSTDCISNKSSLIKMIESKANLILAEDESTKVNIRIINGFISTALSTTKVCILINDKTLQKNKGRIILEFKNAILDIFIQNGVNIELNNLEIKIDPNLNLLNIQPMQDNDDTPINEKSEKYNNEEFNFAQKAKQFIPTVPNYSFERVIISEETKDNILEAIGLLQCEKKVFQEWGLIEIQPHPSTALSFFGPPGTGKTMAAEAVAQKLGKKILKVSYADVESKFHGEGPKMVKSIFYAAEKQQAVLFFDEADSLLSKRLTNVTQGSEQAINSMRSQLLICLEDFKGIVIFATNFVVNYDKAFLTRLINIPFFIPTPDLRKKIWKVHLYPINDGNLHKLNIPLADDIDLDYLANEYQFVGREIRNTVISACVKVAIEKRKIVSQHDLIIACDKLLKEKEQLKKSTEISQESENFLKKAINNKINNTKEK